MTSRFPKVPVTIITGFLGSGKTTLIRHLIENAGGRRLALIINEFGDVGVDGAILRACGIENCPEDNILELANGCICCTVADDFIPTLDVLLSREPRPEHIIVETSGLALPKPLVKAFDWPEIRARVTVDGVIAVVDGPAVRDGRFEDSEDAKAQPDHDNPLEEVFEDQLLCADLILVNKGDLLEEGEFVAIEADLRAHLPRAVKVVETTHGKVPVEVLLGLGANAEDDLANRPSHHDQEEEHDHDDFDTFVVDINELDDARHIVERVKSTAAAHDILRVKGFLPVAGKSARLLLQAVGSRVETRFEGPWADHPRRGRLVVIGRKGLDRPAIEAALKG